MIPVESGILAQGWTPLHGRALVKAQSLVGHAVGPVWAKKFGRKTVFLRFTGVIRLYVLADAGRVHMDRFYALADLDRWAREVLARAYGQVTPGGKVKPGPRHYDSPATGEGGKP